MHDDGDGQATRLDGNAAAGALAEVFRGEASLARTICAGCGASGPLAELMAYGLEMGAILRCPRCDTAVIRVGVTARAHWIDLRGAVSVRFEATLR
jgi:hypothetical protein